MRKKQSKSNFAIVLLCLALTGCLQKNSQKEQNKESAAKLFVTSLDQSKLLSELSIAYNSTKKADITITIDTSKTYQKMDGFGYTLNGGSAMHLQKMSRESRTQILEELFATDENSIGVSYLRLSVGGSDLDAFTWSYNDLQIGETDDELERFSLAYDTLYLIPTLKEILEIIPDIKIMGSPWSPPAWMKDNADTRGGSLLPEYYSVYANYLVKYIQEMEKKGITIAAMTIQNEPLNPENDPSLLMSAEQQATFIKGHLGPRFKQQKIDTKIIVYDHNADRPDYPISILDDPEAAIFIDGSAFHLYGGTIDALSRVHEAHPSKNIYFTEQWIGAPSNFSGDFSWHMEHIIIGAARNWSKTALEWNLAADENQEPHTDRGGCDRCLGALTISGDSIVRNTAYYVIAHASKFVSPGSVRVASNNTDKVANVAFKSPTGQIVVILKNKTESPTIVGIKLGSQSITFSMEAGAAGTLII